MDTKAYTNTKMAKKEVCAVVATFNRRELVKKCIESIRMQEGAECDIIIIDNGSTDGTENLFKTELASVDLMYFNTGENLGSAGAQAIGIREAVQMGYKYIWLMDDDVFPMKDALYKLLDADKKLDGDWGILSSVAYWVDGTICEANRQKKTLFTFMNEDDYKREFVRAFMVSAASMFIKSEAVKKVGLPISEYFIYTDDYEFSSRIARNYPVYVVTESKVTHAMKKNMKCNLVSETPDRLHRYQYLYRNDVHCYKGFGIAGYGYLALKFLYTFLLVLLKEKDCREQKLDTLITGYRNGLKFKPKIQTIDELENDISLV